MLCVSRAREKTFCLYPWEGKHCRTKMSPAKFRSVKVIIIPLPSQETFLNHEKRIVLRCVRTPRHLQPNEFEQKPNYVRHCTRFFRYVYRITTNFDESIEFSFFHLPSILRVGRWLSLKAIHIAANWNHTSSHAHRHILLATKSSHKPRRVS